MNEYFYINMLIVLLFYVRFRENKTEMRLVSILSFMIFGPDYLVHVITRYNGKELAERIY